MRTRTGPHARPHAPTRAYTRTRRIHSLIAGSQKGRKTIRVTGVGGANPAEGIPPLSLCPPSPPFTGHFASPPPSPRALPPGGKRREALHGHARGAVCLIEGVEPFGLPQFLGVVPCVGNGPRSDWAFSQTDLRHPSFPPPTLSLSSPQLGLPPPLPSASARVIDPRRKENSRPKMTGAEDAREKFGPIT